MARFELSDQVLTLFRGRGWQLYERKNFSFEKPVNEPVREIQTDVEYLVYPWIETSSSRDIKDALYAAAREDRLAAVNTGKMNVNLEYVLFQGDCMLINTDRDHMLDPLFYRIKNEDITEFFDETFRSLGPVDEWDSKEISDAFDAWGYSLAFWVKDPEHPFEHVKLKFELQEGVRYFPFPKKSSFPQDVEYARREAEVLGGDASIFSVEKGGQPIYFSQFELWRSTVLLSSNDSLVQITRQEFSDAMSTLKYVPINERSHPTMHFSLVAYSPAPPRDDVGGPLPLFLGVNSGEC